uniref:Tetraspanin n=1 Tax=Trichuris muris TaxID=70415 RepID=A0A5S6QAD5_TRIMR
MPLKQQPALRIIQLLAIVFSLLLLACNMVSFKVYADSFNTPGMAALKLAKEMGITREATYDTFLHGYAVAPFTSFSVMAYTLFCMLAVASERRRPLCLSTITGVLLGLTCLTLSCILLTTTVGLDGFSERMLDMGTKNYFSRIYEYRNSAMRGYVDWVLQKIGCCKFSDSGRLPYIMYTPEDPYIACIVQNGLSVGVMRMPLACYNVTVESRDGKRGLSFKAPWSDNSTDALDAVCPADGKRTIKDTTSQMPICRGRLSEENSPICGYTFAIIITTTILFTLAVFCFILRKNVVDPGGQRPTKRNTKGKFTWRAKGNLNYWNSKRLAI